MPWHMSDPDKDRGSGTKALSEAYLERAAVFYLQRFASSSENLRQVLTRKARRRARASSQAGEDGPEVDVAPLVDAVVARAVAAGLLDDRTYADAKLVSLLRRGTSARTARAALASKGVGAELVSAALAEAAPDDLAQARRYAERRRLGPWRSRPDPSLRERDLAALARAGFPYRVATQVLDADPDGEP